MEHPSDPDILEFIHASAGTSGSHTDEEDPTPNVHPNFNFELVVFQASFYIPISTYPYNLFF